ncbi:hypothetical protein ACUV84_041310 [Puccinellia chinampoensis]
MRRSSSLKVGISSCCLFAILREEVASHIRPCFPDLVAPRTTASVAAYVPLGRNRAGPGGAIHAAVRAGELRRAAPRLSTTPATPAALFPDRRLPISVGIEPERPHPSRRGRGNYSAAGALFAASELVRHHRRAPRRTAGIYSVADVPLRPI